MLKMTVNEVELAYERRGKGKPLVLIHGYPLDHSIWEPVVPWLEKDFDLILPDLPGFGGSEPLGGDCSMEGYASVAAGLLDGLGIQKAFVAGHSMGGYVALSFARAYPKRTLGLGLLASQAVADTPERKSGRYQTAERVEANGVGEVAESMPGLLTADAALQAKLKQLILRQSPTGVAGALRAMAERPDMTSSLAGFDFPVVVVHGLADKIMPVERAFEVRAAVKNGHLIEIKGAGHMPMMEAPELTAEALKALK
jgi:pimeloyl-ACP methyl ester carboxylesterase